MAEELVMLGWGTVGLQEAVRQSEARPVRIYRIPASAMFTLEKSEYRITPLGMTPWAVDGWKWLDT